MGFSFLLLSISALLAILSSPVVTIQDYQPLRQPILYQSECAKNGVSESTSADNSTKPGTLHVNLSVRLTRFTSDYVDFNTRAYNQEIPAPTIKVCPGDRLVVILTNTLEAGNSNNTKLHVHGMHVSPVGDADNVMPIVRLENSDSVFMISARIIQQGHSDRPTDFPEPLAAMDDLVLILQTICIENCDNMDAEVPGALESKYSDDDMTGMTGMIGEESSDEKATWPTDLEVVEDEAYIPMNDTSFLTVL
ncbi:hypothetical protein PHYBOEH_010462 [Phytophthora boehmeriae]|uniref:Plastocyanin-like domain-containing protein n=1 Tax=Phytophthora boehmeriae TaxID=109152 RepID=A0A8T1VR95_9STRA|nr:hypothetical protein PHYBOEH_010462 [Phytophthora boehmeriae]